MLFIPSTLQSRSALEEVELRRLLLCQSRLALGALTGGMLLPLFCYLKVNNHDDKENHFLATIWCAIIQVYRPFNFSCLRQRFPLDFQFSPA
jgi:hypothetical protein